MDALRLPDPARLLPLILPAVALALVTLCRAASPEAFEVVAARSYYTNESTGQLILLSLPDSPGPVEVELLVDDEILSAAAEPDRGRRLTTPFAVTRLGRGSTVITCRLLLDGNEIARASAVVTRLPHRPNAVKIDRISGGLIVDDLPFFPFGFYCYSPVQPTLAEEEVVRGFNMMSPYQSNDPDGRAERRAYMDRAAELGVKVHYHLLSVAGGGGVSSGGPVSEEVLQREEWLRAEVEAFRDHPALLAWYISDEPTGHNMPPEALEQSYRVVRELDPYHPISIVFMAPQRAGEYAGGMDVVMTDPYPIPHNPPDFVAAAVRAITDVFEPAKPVWLVPQAFGGNEWWTREPTAREQRVMTYLGIVEGATGIQYFIRHGLSGFPKSPIMWAAASRAALEVGALTPALLSHEARPAVTSVLESVRAAAWRDRGTITVIAVNTDNQPRQMQLLIEGVEYTGEVEVLFEDRIIEVVGVPASERGVFSRLLLPAEFLTRPFRRDSPFTAEWPRTLIEDVIDAYDTRIYRLQEGPAADAWVGLNPRNKLLNPSFEWSPSPGTPAGVYAAVGEGRGATYFTDPRVAYHGRQSLRLHTPREGEGVVISPYAPAVSAGSTYRLSVWAKAPSGRRRPRLELGIGNATGERSAQFAVSSDWRQYAFDGTMAEGTTRASLSVSLATAGTAWLDVLQLHDISPLISAEPMPSGGFTVVLENYLTDSELRYTLDDTEPTRDSSLYTQPFSVNRTTTVRCSVFPLADGIATAGSAVTLHRHDGIGRLPDLLHPYSQRYPGGGHRGLLDGIFGSDYYNDGHWQGFEEIDMDVIIDLERSVPINDLRARFLQNVRVWIFLPTRVSFYVSEDGDEFDLVGQSDRGVAEDQGGSFVRDFSTAGDGGSYRYVRVHAENIGVCPPWHGGAGGKAWVFADEILVNADPQERPASP